MLKAARQGGAGVLGTLLAHWQQHAPREVILCQCGQRMSNRGRHGKGLVTTLGRLPFLRSFFQCQQCHQSRFPDDERLDIVDTSYSPGVRRLMARAGSQTAFEQAAEDLRCYAGIELEAREIERLAEEVGRDVEQWLCQEQEQILHNTNNTSLVSGPALGPAAKFYISFDGTGVPVRKEEWIGRPGKQADGSPALVKPSWAVSSLKSVWIKRVGLSAIRSRPPMWAPLNRARSLAGGCTPKLCGGVWAKPKR